jgi:hypothetical protein
MGLISTCACGSRSSVEEQARSCIFAVELTLRRDFQGPYESGDQMKGLSSGATQIARRKREKRAEERNKSNAWTGSVQMKGRGERWIPLTCVGIRSAVQRRQHGAIRVESGEV